MRVTAPTGFSLIEICVASTLGVVVTTLALTTLSLVMNHQQRNDGTRLGWGRLADQLRRDLHAAERLDPPTVEAPDRCTLHFRKGGSVGYRHEPSALVRTVNDGDAQPIAQETFDLPADSTWRWEQAPIERGKLATLVLEVPATARQRADDREVVKRRELAISAILGRDLRWEAQ